MKIINDLQDVFSTVGASHEILKLPQIVVVGSQSTGKSSVLESIVRQNFLPRGTGIVTRRPLIIQLTQDITVDTPRASFLHCPDVWHTDFDDVSKEIIKNTEQVCGKNKGISSEPLTIKVVAANLPTLTLVDLPGITKVPVGDQPDDIEEQTNNLLKKYIENPHSIILAISPGNNDIANSESLKLAKTVDPHGDRTVGVITKVDLMERTKENLDVLQGKTLPVKLGIIGVINRNQQQINQNMSMEDAIEMEKEYFRNHFHNIANEMGTEYLIQKLCQVLMKTVKDCLPEVIQRITEQKSIQQEILDSLADKVVDEMGTLATYVRLYCEHFNEDIRGTGLTLKNTGGMKLREVFEKDVGTELDKISLPESIESDIELEIRKASGTKPSLFTPNIVFDNLASKILKNFKYPVKSAIKKGCETLCDIIAYVGRDVFRRFPNLKREAHQIAMNLLLLKQHEAEGFIDNYLKLEECYVNTNHRLFTMNRGKVEAENKDENSEELSFEKRNIKVIKGLLDLYIGIIRYQLMDIVPKALICFVVKEFSELLHSTLMKHLFDADKIEDLVKEDVIIEEKRERATKMMEALQKADVITSMFE